MAQSRTSRRQQQDQRRARLEAVRERERRRNRRYSILIIGGALTISALVLGLTAYSIAHRHHASAFTAGSISPTRPVGTHSTAVGAFAVDRTAASPIVGAVVYRGVVSRQVIGPVAYANASTPPVGGAASATVLNCGTYDQAVPNENAVADLANGAVWIAYRPTLPAPEVASLKKIVKSYGGPYSYVDLAPYSWLTSPIAVTAWGVQLTVDSAADTRIKAFVKQYRHGTQSPHPNGTCGPSGGTGSPEGTVSVTPSVTPTVLSS